METFVGVAIATTTWNSCDIIEEFLEYHLSRGVSQILVLDFGSDDGTIEMLRDHALRDQVMVIDGSDVRSSDASNVLLDHVNQSTASTKWWLFIDPDEFVSDPGMLQTILKEAPKEAKVVRLRRFNVTGRQSAVLKGAVVQPFKALNLKIVKPVVRDATERQAASLQTPWIFSAIPGKIAVRLPSHTRINTGNHSTTDGRGTVLPSVDILHFPIRSWKKFDEKIVIAAQDIASNPDLPPNDAWHWKRWIRLRNSGDLHSDYLQQFVADEDVERLLADGVIESITAGRIPA